MFLFVVKVLYEGINNNILISETKEANLTQTQHSFQIPKIVILNKGRQFWF